MAYKTPISPENIPDLISRKEFYQYKSNELVNFKNLVDDDPILSDRFQLRAHQQFIRNLMSPNTEFKRLHLSHGTGLGKCHGRDTKIRMFDFSVKNVQDIKVGDQWEMILCREQYYLWHKAKANYI